MRNIQARVGNFLLPASSDTWLALLRVGLGLQIILYSLSLRSDWNRLFAEDGNALISRDFMEAILDVHSHAIPRIGWLVAIGAHFGLSEATVLFSTWTALFCAGCCLLLGIFSRAAAIAAWFLHLCAVMSGNLMSYGMDNFTTIGLFYLMLAPLPDSYTLDQRIWKPKPKDPHFHGLFRRALQLHLCVIYFFSGLAKCLGAGWWNGTSLWRSLTSPPFNILPLEVLVKGKYVFAIAGLCIWLLEISYPVLIWPKRTRPIWLAGILALHVATGLTMGLHLFALIMIVLNLAAFGPGISRKESEATDQGIPRSVPVTV